MMVLPAMCMYETLSKGAYLSGGVTFLLALMFGRPKAVQVILVVSALTLGPGLAKQMPRMDELNRSEGGIQGRLAAWEWGLQKLEQEPDGIGWKRFVGTFWKENGYPKAAHSAYIQTATELGKKGLFCFIGILYCCLRTLMTVRTINHDEERMRRLLFCLVVSFWVSSWVIDFGARSTLFIIPATVAAYHRQINRRYEEDLAKAKKDMEEFEANEEEFNTLQQQREPFERRKESLKRSELRADIERILYAKPPLAWNQLSFIDFALIYGGYKVAMNFWIYILENF